MKKLVALMGALLLTLVLAAPAAANQKVFIEEESGPFTFPPDGPVTVNKDNEIWRSPWYFGANWACTKDIYYQVSGDSSLWLWYANSVDTTNKDEYMPADAAWPWIKGMAKNGGLDAFYANQDMTGQMVAAKFTNTVHLSDHYLGGTGPDDPETWQEQVSGKFWGINLPGEGIVFHESGTWRYVMSVVLPDKGDRCSRPTCASTGTWCTTTTRSATSSTRGQP